MRARAAQYSRPGVELLGGPQSRGGLERLRGGLVAAGAVVGPGGAPRGALDVAALRVLGQQPPPPGQRGVVERVLLVVVREREQGLLGPGRALVAVGDRLERLGGARALRPLARAQERGLRGVRRVGGDLAATSASASRVRDLASRALARLTRARSASAAGSEASGTARRASSASTAAPGGEERGAARERQLRALRRPCVPGSWSATSVAASRGPCAPAANRAARGRGGRRRRRRRRGRPCARCASPSASRAPASSRGQEATTCCERGDRVRRRGPPRAAGALPAAARCRRRRSTARPRPRGTSARPPRVGRAPPAPRQPTRGRSRAAACARRRRGSARRAPRRAGAGRAAAGRRRGGRGLRRRVGVLLRHAAQGVGPAPASREHGVVQRALGGVGRFAGEAPGRAGGRRDAEGEREG